MSNKLDVTKIELRSIIRYEFLQNTKPMDILFKINNIYGENTIKKSTVYKWIERFKGGNNNIFDEERSGRPKEMSKNDQIKEILDEDPHISLRKISKIVQLSKITVKKIIIEDLKMRKVTYKWIPHKLTEDQKKARFEKSKELLSILENSKQWGNIITGDETWIYYSNDYSSKWIKENEERPKKVRKTISSKKLLVSVYWSINGMKLIEGLKREEKFNKKYFVETILKNLTDNIIKKRPLKKCSGIKIHVDNARPHQANEEIKKYGLVRLVHPPYSPDLAPSDFFLFGYLKKMLEGSSFKDDDDVIEKVREILESMDHTLLKNSYYEWIKRLKKCISLEGEFFE